MSSNRAEAATKRKARARLSITTRLALLYAVSASLMLLVAIAYLFWVPIQSVERGDYYFVVDKVYRLERALREHAEDLAFLDREITWGGQAYDPEKNHVFYSRILDDRGRLVVESQDMATFIPMDQFAAPVDLSSEAAPLEAVQHWRSPQGPVYRVLSARSRSASAGRSWVIQVAMTDLEEDVLIANLQSAALATLVFGILVSAGLGGIVARRGMKPLRAIAAAAERITVSQLNERIDPAHWPEELGALAKALNRMLGRLEDSFARMSQYAADLAHELRTPIHNMMGEAEVALSAERRPEVYRRVLESSLEEFERLSRMINEMLFLARADDPQQHIARVRLDARHEIDAVIEFFDALIESRGVKVSAQGTGELHADPLLFRRAVTNLLSNALRHTQSGGSIVVSIEAAGDNAINVKVCDSGCGIQPEDLPRICDRLYCAERTNDAVSEQTGLGLSIVKSIVELHGGSIAIDSALGRGTTVLMRFPGSLPATA